MIDLDKNFTDILSFVFISADSKDKFRIFLVIFLQILNIQWFWRKILMLNFCISLQPEERKHVSSVVSLFLLSQVRLIFPFLFWYFFMRWGYFIYKFYVLELSTQFLIFKCNDDTKKNTFVLDVCKTYLLHIF